MANDEEDMIEEVEIIQEDTDNAKEFTNAIVYTTTLLLIGGIVTVLMALDTYFKIGPFAPK